VKKMKTSFLINKWSETQGFYCVLTMRLIILKKTINDKKVLTSDVHYILYCPLAIFSYVLVPAGSLPQILELTFQSKLTHFSNSFLCRHRLLLYSTESLKTESHLAPLCATDETVVPKKLTSVVICTYIAVANPFLDMYMYVWPHRLKPPTPALTFLS